MKSAEIKTFLKLLADESGAVIRRYFRTDIGISRKADESPVTVADRTAEEVMRELIMKEFPNHGILGEEFGEHNSESEYRWILDPIDGTKSFICGAQTFGTLIALLYKGKPLFGVINQPVLGEFYFGDNTIAELNGERITVRKCDALSDAVLLTTDHLHFHRYQNGEAFEKLIREVKLYRLWGDCYGYALLASGFADIMIDPIMHIWDTMALLPIVRGAGGTITDYHGNPPEQGESVIASVNKELHISIVDMLNQH